MVSTDPAAGRDADCAARRRAAAARGLVERVPAGAAGAPQPALPGGGRCATLAIAADQFLVRRGERDTTVIAGYPWFTDWGRDTMISLPGLCLATGRHEEARGILRAFAAAVDRGMLPNRFQDRAKPPEYNTVDATLWFFVAIRRYLDATGDEAFVRGELLGVLEDILAWHRRGTRHGIRVDDDGLLYAGEPGVQLTWMDARVGDWVVTPRRGKPVEIQALWYNALRVLAELESRLRPYGAKAPSSRPTRNAPAAVSSSCSGTPPPAASTTASISAPARLPTELDDRVRPNQVLALSLPYELLDPVSAASVLDVVEARLLTPVGLRSLDPRHADYRPRYEGGPAQRDAVYHQGVVWSWLLGSFITALVRVRGDEGRRQARCLLERAAAHLGEACVGSVSEIFDAEPPFAPHGCPAQAWGVAEWLRAAIEDAGLGVGPVIGSTSDSPRSLREEPTGGHRHPRSSERIHAVAGARRRAPAVRSVRSDPRNSEPEGASDRPARLRQRAALPRGDRRGRSRARRLPLRGRPRRLPVVGGDELAAAPERFASTRYVDSETLALTRAAPAGARRWSATPRTRSSTRWRTVGVNARSSPTSSIAAAPATAR